MLKNDQWFSEGTVPGTRHGNITHNFRIENLLFNEKSNFQEICVFDNPVYGRVLVLDGIVQLSSFDEFVYHEMLVHPIALSHGHPKHILIIGGGDGGTLRECLKYNPERIVQVEIDRTVIDVAKKHLSFTHTGSFDDPRLSLVHTDGHTYIKQQEREFDLILVDCSDPVGPSTALFEKSFYIDVKNALKEDGVGAFQVGSLLDRELVASTYQNLTDVFGKIAPYRLTIPCYHCGEYCFMGVTNTLANLTTISVDTLESHLSRYPDVHNTLKYYSPNVHKASQTMPAKPPF